MSGKGRSPVTLDLYSHLFESVDREAADGLDAATKPALRGVQQTATRAGRPQHHRRNTAPIRQHVRLSTSPVDSGSRYGRVLRGSTPECFAANVRVGALDDHAVFDLEG